MFLTGDVGFMALEPLRAAAQERFINAGIAEQNMVSVAAGLASERSFPPVAFAMAGPATRLNSFRTAFSSLASVPP